MMRSSRPAPVFGRRGRRLHLLLPAEPGGAPPCRHLRRALAGVGGLRLPTASDRAPILPGACGLRRRKSYPGYVAVLSESPAVSAERASRTRGQEPGQIADGRGARPLAGTARLHPFLPELVYPAGHQPVGPTGAEALYCYPKSGQFEPGRRKVASRGLSPCLQGESIRKQV